MASQKASDSDTKEKSSIVDSISNILDNDPNNGWTQINNNILKKWVSNYTVQHTLCYFLNDHLKKEETKFKTVIFILTSIITLFVFIQSFSDVTPYPSWLDITFNVIEGVCGVSIGIILKWMDSKEYISRIGSCERYLEKIEKNKSILSKELDLPFDMREEASEFIKRNKDAIIEELANIPDISPDEMVKIIEHVKKINPEISKLCGWELYKLNRLVKTSEFNSTKVPMNVIIESRD